MGPGSRFDPEGEGYDIETAQKYIDEWPLLMPKPTEYQGDYVRDPDVESFQSWVWHPEENNGAGDYLKHSGSLDPRTGMVLKGRRASTWDLTDDAEMRMGSHIIQGADGRYYARPIPWR